MIPDYQTLMLPLLQRMADGQEYLFRDLIERLAGQFRLTDEERKELLPSGTQPAFDNRVGWAATYLKKAGLLSSPKRATYVITDLGREILQENPGRIDAKFLRQFPEFVAFVNPSRNSDTVVEESGAQYQPRVNTKTPEETIGTAYQEIRDTFFFPWMEKEATDRRELMSAFEK